MHFIRTEQTPFFFFGFQNRAFQFVRPGFQPNQRYARPANRTKCVFDEHTRARTGRQNNTHSHTHTLTCSSGGCALTMGALRPASRLIPIASVCVCVCGHCTGCTRARTHTHTRTPFLQPHALSLGLSLSFWPSLMRVHAHQSTHNVRSQAHGLLRTDRGEGALDDYASVVGYGVRCVFCN